MKKPIFLLISVLMFTAAISCQNLKKQSVVKGVLIGYEKSMWEMYKTKDAKSLEPLVADDFYDIYENGRVIRRKEWFADMLATEILDYSLENFDVVMLGKNAAIVVYKAESHGTQDGRTGFNRVRVTSVWAKRNGKWRNVFYLENRIPEATNK